MKGNLTIFELMVDSDDEESPSDSEFSNDDNQSRWKPYTSKTVRGSAILIWVLMSISFFQTDVHARSSRQLTTTSPL